MDPCQVWCHGLDDVLLGKLALAKCVADFAGIPVTDVRSTEKGGQFVEFTLRPIGQRMIVTLGASDVGSEEDVEGVGQVIEGHARITEKVTSGARTSDGALGGK